MKLLVVLLFALMQTSSVRTEDSDHSEEDPDSCDTMQLYTCRALVTATPFTLPRNREELDLFCSSAYICELPIKFEEIIQIPRNTPNGAPCGKETSRSPIPAALQYNTRVGTVLFKPKTPLKCCIVDSTQPRCAEGLFGVCKPIYNNSHECVDDWMKRCLPADSRKIVEQEIGGSRALMRFLCTNGSATRKEYLEHSECWAKVSNGLEKCLGDLDDATDKIARRTHRLVIFGNSDELCCAQEEYLGCVARLAEECPPKAGTMLRRLVFISVRSMIKCSKYRPETCAAPDHVAAVMPLTLCGGMILAYQYHLH